MLVSAWEAKGSCFPLAQPRLLRRKGLAAREQLLRGEQKVVEQNVALQPRPFLSICLGDSWLGEANSGGGHKCLL